MSSNTSTTLTLTANGSAALGTKDLTVTGTGGGCVQSLTVGIMVTAADQSAAFTWPLYQPNLNFDFKSIYPSLPNPTAILDDAQNVAGTAVVPGGTWCFRYGPNKNSLVTSAAWIPMLNRLNYDFAWLRENMGWPADLRHRSGYYSSVYLFGSGMSTDDASNTDLGGWQSSIFYNGYDWPMILMSYYPVYSFDPACPYSDRVDQQGATVHEGIHAMFADAPGVKEAGWFHEGGNTFLQGEMAAQLTGDYSSMGWLSAASMLAPFMPIECYSGWLQDGSFGGPSAEGVDHGPQYGSTWRELFGGVQYSEAFPHFLTEKVSKGCAAWIWQNCPGRVLEGMATSPGGMGAAQMRRLIMEYRARSALCDFGKWSGAYQALMDQSWNVTLGPEYEPFWIACNPWVSTCYQPTTKTGTTLTPTLNTLPGWTGANFVPLKVTGTGTISVNFTPLGDSLIVPENANASSVPIPITALNQNMTCQLVYRAKDGSPVYGQPVSEGQCSIRLDKAPRDNLVVAVITSTDFCYRGEDSRKRKYDYRLALGQGVTGTADVNQKWYKTITQPALKAIAGNGENYIFWGDVAEADTFTLKRATSPGGPYTNIVTRRKGTQSGSAALAYIDQSRTNGTAYYYVATASGSNQTSINSNEVAATPVASAVTLNNSGFESPKAGASALINPSGASWVFSGTAGITGTSSSLANANRPPAEGQQAAFLQNQGSISQTITGFQAGTAYSIKFLASQRQSVYQLGNIFELRVDNQPLKTFFPSQQGSTWGEFTATFTATASQHSLSFKGTNANGGNNVVLIDRVLIQRAAVP